MESEASPRRHANAVGRDDAQRQRAGGIADAVDDHALAAVANHGVLGLVLIDQPAMVARDAIVSQSQASSPARAAIIARTRNDASSTPNPHDTTPDGYVPRQFGKNLSVFYLDFVKAVPAGSAAAPHCIEKWILLRGSAGPSATAHERPRLTARKPNRQQLTIWAEFHFAQVTHADTIACRQSASHTRVTVLWRGLMTWRGGDHGNDHDPLSCHRP